MNIIYNMEHLFRASCQFYHSSLNKVVIKLGFEIEILSCVSHLTLKLSLMLNSYNKGGLNLKQRLVTYLITCLIHEFYLKSNVPAVL